LITVERPLKDAVARVAAGGRPAPEHDLIARQASGRSLAAAAGALATR
jgi:hypothetical protein